MRSHRVCQRLPRAQAVCAQIEGAVLTHKFSTFYAGQKLARSGRDFFAHLLETYWFLPTLLLFAISLLSAGLQPSGTVFRREASKPK